MAKLTIEMNLPDFIKEVSNALDDLTRGGCPPPIPFAELVAGALFHDWMYHLRRGQGSKNGVVYDICKMWEHGNRSLAAELALDQRETSNQQKILVLTAIKQYFEDRMIRKEARLGGIRDLLSQLDQLTKNVEISEGDFKQAFVATSRFLYSLRGDEYRKAVAALRGYGDDFDHPPIDRWMLGKEVPVPGLRQQASRRMLEHLKKHYR